MNALFPNTVALVSGASQGIGRAIDPAAAGGVPRGADGP